MRGGTGGGRCRSEEAGLGRFAVKDGSESNVSDPGCNVPWFIKNSGSTEIILQIVF